MTEAKAASPLESAAHSIAWFHQLGGELSLSDHPLVKSTLAGAQRLLAHQTTKKEPITVSQLEQLVASKADSMACLHNIRSVVICLLAFAAFSDLMSLLSLFVPMLRSKMARLSYLFNLVKLISVEIEDCCCFFYESNLSGCYDEPLFR